MRSQPSRAPLTAVPEQPYSGSDAGEAAAWTCAACGFVQRYLAPIRRDEVGACVRCGSQDVAPLKPRRAGQDRVERA